MDAQRTERVTVTSNAAMPTESVRSETVTRSGSMSDFFVSKTNQVIFSIIGIIDLLLAIRVVLLLLGANQVGIASFIINLTQVFVAPFAGIFPSQNAGTAHLDAAAILAIIMYVIFGIILGIIISLFSTKTQDDV